MFQWNLLFQQITAALALATVGGLWAMYVRVLGHSDKIMQLQKEVAEQHGKFEVHDTRLRAIENTTIRIDLNVQQLLETQRRESPARTRARISETEGR